MNIHTLHRSVLVTLALGAAFLFGASRATHAQYTFFPNNATINYALPTSSDVAVVGQTNYNDWMVQHIGWTSPTINIVAGASLGGGAYVLDNSVVNMSGGFCQGFLASDSTTVNITGGTVVDVLTFWYATVNIYSGATITGSLSVQNGGTINVFGGKIGSIGKDAFAQGSYHTLNIYGGTFVSGQTFVEDGGTLNMYGSPGTLVVTGYIWLNGVRTPLWGFQGRRTVTATLLSSNATFSYAGSTSSGWTEYQLSGQLGDGTNVTGMKVFKKNDGSSFNVVNPLF